MTELPMSPPRAAGGDVGLTPSLAARVVFTSGFARRYTNGVREFEVEAKNLRGVMKAMEELFPGLGAHAGGRNHGRDQRRMHETGYFQPVPPGAEVFFIPRIEGG